MILLALLAVLGIPIWLVVGVLIAVWQIRRTLKQQPGVFEVLVRAEDSDKWPRELSYGRVVRDVLVLYRGVALLRVEVLALDAVSELDLGEAPKCGFHANPITGSTAIRSAVPRVSDHPTVRPPQR